MNLQVQNFIETQLLRAQYERDESVNAWAGWIKGFPGIYAQGSTLEETRNELAEMLEEYLLVSLQKNTGVKGFKILQHAGAN
jgi:predicted RNase H-like HicB family nuclease